MVSLLVGIYFKNVPAAITLLLLGCMITGFAYFWLPVEPILKVRDAGKEMDRKAYMPTA